MAIESFISDFGVVELVGKEATLRTPAAMLESMRIRHHAFTGEQDTGVHLGTTLGWLQSKGAKDHPLRVYDVPGDHFESLAPACAAFFELAEGRASPIAARSPEALDAAGRDPALALYQSETVLGEGPFGEPEPDSAISESQLLEFEGWMLKLPAAATTEILVPDWPKTVGFYTEDFGGSLTVAQIPPENQAGFRPLDAAHGALSNALTMMTPTAARFFVTESGVGLEVRGLAESGTRTYARMYATRDSVVTLALTPSDAPEVHAVVASLELQHK